ncbi:MAG: flavin reductase [Bacteroidota bacterium]
MKRPWNIINSSVYSLMTQGEKVNFNICTYVSAVSIKPKMYCFAIDYTSLTYQNLKRNSVAVLNILSNAQKELVKPLGKKSGLRFDKLKFLSDQNELIEWEGMQVLKSSRGWIKFQLLKELDIQGDHALFIFEILKFKTLSEDDSLDFQQLIEERIIL